MSRRGRPPSPRAASATIVHVKLRLYPGEDDDLIAFFEAALPRLRAAMVKQALRSGTRDSARMLDPDDEVTRMMDCLVS